MKRPFTPGRSIRCLIAAATVALASSTALADVPAFAGSFSDGKLTAQWSESGSGYVGTITLGGHSFPAQATASGDRLAGTFTASGKPFDFTATLSNDTMTLVSGVTTYTLTRAPDAAAHPSSAGVTPTSLGDFKLLGSTPVGSTLFIKLAGANTLDAAIDQTIDALAKVLDARPTPIQAFADAKQKTNGGASVSGKLNGHDVRGLIFCDGGANGGSATVILAPPGATQFQLAVLMKFMPVPLKLTTHTFPDNSGSIDLPDGWTTNTQTATYGILATGPAGQTVAFGNAISVNTPDCKLVRLAKQNHDQMMAMYENQVRQQEQMRRQYPNMPPIRPPMPPPDLNPDPNVQWPQLTFCDECSGAQEVLQKWYPISEAKQRRAGGKYSTLEKVIEVVPADSNPYIPGSKSGIAYLMVTDHDGSNATLMRVINHISTAPVAPGEAWQLGFTVMRAPDASFDADLPTMNAIINSVKLNQEAIGKRMSDDGKVIQKMFADNQQQLLAQGRAFRQAQDDHFNHFESQIAAQEQARHDAASDFIEYIGGVRQVMDNQTGKTVDVDLFHSGDTTAAMNQLVNDPSRFVEEPLRDRR